MCHAFVVHTQQGDVTTVTTNSLLTAGTELKMSGRNETLHISSEDGIKKEEIQNSPNIFFSKLRESFVYILYNNVLHKVGVSFLPRRI